MHSTAQVANQYLRFLHQMHRTTRMGRLVDLEPVCSRLLDEIAIENHSSSPLTVTALMGLSHIASPATLHRKMQSLLQEGLIELSTDAHNKRSKFVVLSKKGQRRYQTLSTLMAEAYSA
jgi:DNA-binding MarR family transcriptional regulator